jgi:hypothetical protein
MSLGARLIKDLNVAWQLGDNALVWRNGIVWLKGGGSSATKGGSLHVGAYQGDAPKAAWIQWQRMRVVLEQHDAICGEFAIQLAICRQISGALSVDTAVFCAL